MQCDPASAYGQQAVAAGMCEPVRNSLSVVNMRKRSTYTVDSIGVKKGFTAMWLLRKIGLLGFVAVSHSPARTGEH
jgi:hypothetical protein